MTPHLRISLTDYRRRVYASWLGQCVGNLFGLGYENKFIHEPMPPDQEPVWADWVLDGLREADGAFSDDDTDIEYMYLLAMEAADPNENRASACAAREVAPSEHKATRELTYAELAARWRHHVRSHVWVANRAALGLMHHGLTPPLTGARGINPHWFQIDPQLVNEIWGVTAPGMLSYAADKTAWAARIMADDWGIEPAVHYGVMYAAAFFERDVAKLVDKACDHLPPASRFAHTVRRIRELHAMHRHDWRAARRALYEEFYLGEPPGTRTIWNANLNGAAAILALLYGGGDFRRTLEMCCRIGFDTDNQAASMCGLVAILTGAEGIPRDLAFPLPERDWKLPLNDRYHNRTRFDLPDATLFDQARRIADQGVATVLRAGGKIESDANGEWLCIRGDARFIAPCEAPNAAPSTPSLSAPRPRGSPSSGPELGAPPRNAPTPGVSMSISPPSLRASSIPDRSRGLSRRAARVISHAATLDEEALSRIVVFSPRATLADSVEIIRAQPIPPHWPTRDADEPLSFYGFSRRQPGGGNVAGDEPLHYYGYVWDEPVTIDCLLFRVGTLEEAGGWFVDPRVEILATRGHRGGNINVDEPATAGTWQLIAQAAWSPPYPAGDEPLTKAPWIPYVIRFAPVSTRGIRIAGAPGGVGKTSDPGSSGTPSGPGGSETSAGPGGPAGFTSIASLEAYAIDPTPS